MTDEQRVRAAVPGIYLSASYLFTGRPDMFDAINRATGKVMASGITRSKVWHAALQHPTVQAREKSLEEANG